MCLLGICERNLNYFTYILTVKTFNSFNYNPNSNRPLYAHLMQEHPSDTRVRILGIPTKPSAEPPPTLHQIPGSPCPARLMGVSKR